MTKVCIFTQGGVPVGFELSGHSGAGIYGSDIVCAAVSSAAYLTANTLTEAVGAQCSTVVRDGYMKVMVDLVYNPTDRLSECRHILQGFVLHMKQLREQYPRSIRIITINSGKEQ